MRLYNGRTDRSFALEDTPLSQWSYRELKRRIDLTCMDGRQGIAPFEQMPEFLDIGFGPNSLAGKALECGMQTNQDSKHRERGANIVWDPMLNRILVEKTKWFFQGTSRSVSIHFTPYTTADRIIAAQNSVREYLCARNPEVTKETVDKVMSTQEQEINDATRLQCVGAIHSHPNATTFSIADVLQLISRRSFLRPRISVLCSSDGTLRALLPSHHTRHINKDQEYAQYYDQYSALLHEQSNKVQQRIKNGNFKTQLDLNHMILAAHERVILAIAEQHKLSYYVGDASGVLKRVRAAGAI